MRQMIVRIPVVPLERLMQPSKRCWKIRELKKLLFLCLLSFNLLLCGLCHVFYNHDIMSETDVSYGLPTVRVRRDVWGTEGRLGPLYTHVKTEQGGTFKWGAKHMVGKMFAGTKAESDEDGF